MNSFLAAIQRFGFGRLAVLLGVGGGGAAALIAILMSLTAEPMALLYSNLDLREAGSITQALDQGGIKYEVKGDGSTIMVPRDKVASTRLLLAGKGLPTSDSVGYEIFDTQNALGQTDFVQQLNMKRATEGELARTIRSLDGVTFARVHLVLPERQLFQDNTDQPSASVTIGVGARSPSTDQVRAVQNLVGGAVPNLKPERVVVIDQHGKTLSAEGDSGLGGKEAQDQKASIEDTIRQRIKNLVEGVVGVGKARVQVSADIDMSQQTTHEEKFDPDGQVVRSEQTNESNSTENSGGGSTSAASASSNLPGGTVTANTPGSGNSNTGNESTTNYEISKTVTDQVQEPGTIKRLSVAVAVDGSTAPAGKDGKPGAYSARSPEEMQHLNDLVKAAMGFSTDRGDQLQVVNVRFPDAEDGEGVAASSPLMGFDKNDIMRGVELGVLALVSLLILFFVLRPMIRAAASGAMAAGTALIPMGGGGGAATRIVTLEQNGQPIQVQIDAATGQPLALPGPDIEQKIDIARIEGQVKASSVKHVAEFVDKHPEASVSILRSWLHESA